MPSLCGIYIHIDITEFSFLLFFGGVTCTREIVFFSVKYIPVISVITKYFKLRFFKILKYDSISNQIIPTEYIVLNVSIIKLYNRCITVSSIKSLRYLRSTGDLRIRMYTRLGVERTEKSGIQFWKSGLLYNYNNSDPMEAGFTLNNRSKRVNITPGWHHGLNYHHFSNIRLLITSMRSFEK